VSSSISPSADTRSVPGSFHGIHQNDRDGLGRDRHRTAADHLRELLRGAAVEQP
jgi:hypothetical protein